MTSLGGLQCFVVVVFNTRWQHTPLDEARTFQKKDVIDYLEAYVKNPPEAEGEGVKDVEK